MIWWCVGDADDDRAEVVIWCDARTQGLSRTSLRRWISSSTPLRRNHPLDICPDSSLTCVSFVGTISSWLLIASGLSRYVMFAVAVNHAEPLTRSEEIDRDITCASGRTCMRCIEALCFGMPRHSWKTRRVVWYIISAKIKWSPGPGSSLS